MILRTLALDYGEKRIGIAVSDSLGITAQGVATLEYKSLDKVFPEILKQIHEYHAVQILIGLPLDTEGQEGKQAKKVREFGKGLSAFLQGVGMPLPLIWWDESMSTMEAEAHLLAADVSRAKRRKVIDKLAAVMILKNYMETQCSDD